MSISMPLLHAHNALSFPQNPAGKLVREGGVEPPPHHWDTDLNRARLPIPPLARALKGYGGGGERVK